MACCDAEYGGEARKVPSFLTHAPSRRTCAKGRSSESPACLGSLGYASFDSDFDPIRTKTLDSFACLRGGSEFVKSFEFSKGVLTLLKRLVLLVLLKQRKKVQLVKF